MTSHQEQNHSGILGNQEGTSGTTFSADEQAAIDKFLASQVAEARADSSETQVDDEEDLTYPDGSHADSQWVPRVGVDEDPQKPQQKKFWTKTKIISSIALGGALLAGGTTVAITTHSSPSPSPDQQAKGGGEAAPIHDQLTAGQKEFIKTYSDRYKDPLAVMNAEVALETSGHFKGQSLILSDETINSFDPNAPISGVVGPLGFGYNALPLDTQLESSSVDAPINFFNSPSVQDSLDRYMNYTAKNPGAKAQAMIDANFQRYAAFRNEDNGATLMSILKSVTATYGPEANYTVVPASADETTPNTTHFLGNNTLIDSVDPTSGIPTMYNNTIDLAINVQTFGDTGMRSQEVEVVKGVSFFVERVPAEGDPDPGIVAIGAEQTQ